MATFNGEKFLRGQLESISRQSHRPDELVVTDDCSTDQTLQILKEFQAEAPFMIRVSVNQCRLGYAENFLRAAGQCTGDLIAFCDQDDVWMENKLERCIREFSSQSVYLVAHSMIEVDSDLKTLGYSPAFRKSQTISRGNETPALRWSLGCTEVIRREVIRELLVCWPEDHKQYASSQRNGRYPIPCRASHPLSRPWGKCNQSAAYSPEKTGVFSRCGPRCIRKECAVPADAWPVASENCWHQRQHYSVRRIPSRGAQILVGC
jgi:glycosyltransferase involved in cell wall biosynthesis